MKVFENINREYTPGINLDVLDKTYNTLEKGHKESVKAASELKTAIANMAMNEAEDGFKQQLLNEIQTTIDDNTIYGNSYGALDDIILSSGNIASDPRIIGRLKTQQEYLAFKDKVDKMQIPEGMKDMYKEENPYTYKDKIDSTTGKIIGAETWKPNSTPVNTIPQSVIQKHALDIASKQSGSFDTISFLDTNGNPTTDPLKSKDGNIYKQVGTRFEKLPANKIAEAYRLAIQSIPGAEESLKQDYKYANYSYNKERNNEQIPLYNGLTDQYGRVYSYNQWLERKINTFSRLSAVNNVHTNTTFGTALSQSITNPDYSNPYIANGKGGVNGFGIDSNIPVAKVGTKDVVSNSYTSAIKDKEFANKLGLGIVKKYTNNFKDADSISDIIKELKVSGPGNAANKLIQQYGKNMSLEERFNLIKSFKSYYHNNKCISDIEKANGADMDALRFTSEIASGNFTNGNRYSREINEFLNNHFKNNEFAEWRIGKDVMSELCNLYGKDVTISTLKDKGIEIIDNGDDTYDVKIGAGDRNLIPEFASNLRKADSMVPGSIWGFIKDAFGSVHSSNYDEKGLDINIKNPFTKDYWTRNTNRNIIHTVMSNTLTNGIRTNPFSEINTSFDELVRIYDDAKEQAAKAESKAGINKGVREYSIYPNKTCEELYYDQYGNYLGLTYEGKKKLAEDARTKVRNSFANAPINAGYLELVDEANHANKINDDKDLRLAIQSACLNKDTDITISVIKPTETTLNNPIGYRLSFIMPNGFTYGDYKEGDLITINSYGVINENTEFNPSSNPRTIAENILINAKATNSSNIEVLGFVSGFGDTKLYRTKNGYQINDIVYDETEAISYINTMLNISILKDLYRSNHFNYTDPNVVENFNNTYNEYVNLLCNLNGKSYEYNNSQLFNYLNTNE
jgi:hypothetical protein